MKFLGRKVVPNFLWFVPQAPPLDSFASPIDEPKIRFPSPNPTSHKICPPKKPTYVSHQTSLLRLPRRSKRTLAKSPALTYPQRQGRLSFIVCKSNEAL